MEVAIAYRVTMPQPTNHRFRVEIRVEGWTAPVLDLKLPVWTPGSYLVREYARHLQGFAVRTEGEPLPWQKRAKNHWRIETAGCDRLTLSYEVYAHELTVRTNHLDSSHGYFNPAALLAYVVGCTDQPLRVTVEPPDPDWQVVTPLPLVLGDSTGAQGVAPTFLATDYDTLVDSPFEIGVHRRYDFEALGKPHCWVVWGDGPFDSEQVIRDTQRIIETEAAIFGGVPYDRYLFLLHLAPSGYGGLEHKTSCSLIYERQGLQDPASYERFMQLVAHEFFHLWNVKRIRPDALECFDYDQENYTPSLWFCEGVTSYYDLWLPFRAGIYGANTFLAALGKDVTRLLTTPGRLVQPLGESGFDAWIKLYRREAHSDNNQISYYLKGELVALLLELLIRDRSANQRSLDDVMRLMWQRFGKDEVGFSPAELQIAFEEVAGEPLTELFHLCLATTEELPLGDYLAPFGLGLEAEPSLEAYSGLSWMDKGRGKIKFVVVDSPAERLGLEIGDEVLAVQGQRWSAADWSRILSQSQAGDRLDLTWFHGDDLCQGDLIVEAPRPSQWAIAPVSNPTPAQRDRCQGWLGVEPEDLS